MGITNGESKKQQGTQRAKAENLNFHQNETLIKMSSDFQGFLKPFKLENYLGTVNSKEG